MDIISNFFHQFILRIKNVTVIYCLSVNINTKHTNNNCLREKSVKYRNYHQNIGDILVGMIYQL